MGLSYGSVCSGIEAASVAWEPLGWRPAWFAEIDPFPCAVLAKRFPGVPNLGDFTTIPASAGPIDLLVGGTPCQSFSVAGLRLGLADDRGNLALEFLRLADRLRPRWLVRENVPGVLSSSGGRDFGAFLGGLAELGYGFAYRVLDAQYVRVDGFGRAVPQRRRRVFVVGCAGDWRCAAAVLFDRASLSGDSPPQRTAGEGVAGTLAARTHGGGGLGTDFDLDGGLVARTVTAHGYRIDAETETLVVAHTLRADGFDASEDGTGRGIPLVACTLPASNGGVGSGMHPVVPVAFCPQAGGKQTSLGFDPLSGTSPSVIASQVPATLSRWAVRRLTPRECERLQGFPDDWTLVTYRRKPAKDAPRYKAVGNSMAVNVMRWIGLRIQMVEGL